MLPLQLRHIKGTFGNHLLQNVAITSTTRGTVYQFVCFLKKKIHLAVEFCLF